MRLIPFSAEHTEELDITLPGCDELRDGQVVDVEAPSRRPTGVVGGFTPLLSAARSGHIPAVAALLAGGSSLDESLSMNSARSAGGVAQGKQEPNLDAFLLASGNAWGRLQAPARGRPLPRRRRREAGHLEPQEQARSLAHRHRRGHPARDELRVLERDRGSAAITSSRIKVDTVVLLGHVEPEESERRQASRRVRRTYQQP
jgi:hypothetical protein